MRALALTLAACSVGCLAPVAVDPVADTDEGSSSTGADTPEIGSSTSSSGDAPDPTSGGQNPEPGTTEAGTTSGTSDETSGESSSSTGGIALEGCDAHPDALLCDDFEGDIDETRWDIRTGEGGSVEQIDGVLRVSLPSAIGAHGFLRTSAPFPVPDNRFFGRVRFRISPESPSFHDYLFAAAGPLDGTLARYRLDSNGGGQLNSRYTHASVEQHGGWRRYGTWTEPETWTCIEWEFDGSTNSIRFWFDGVFDEDMFVDGATEDPPWVAPPFETFELGYHTYQAPDNADAFEILYDDLVLDTERIGCPG